MYKRPRNKEICPHQRLALINSLETINLQDHIFSLSPPSSQ